MLSWQLCVRILTSKFVILKLSSQFSDVGILSSDVPDIQEGQYAALNAVDMNIRRKEKSEAGASLVCLKI